MNINRRYLLKLVGSTVATLGLSQLNVLRQAENYGQTLGKSTSRKLALLIGIDTYSSYALQGCVTDVELQRQLLIYRFGFNPKDILTLTNEQATRQGILTAFEEHLIKQAKPDDVVVFHYSGHGSRVFDPNPIVSEPGQKFGLNGTFVPVDSPLPVINPQERSIVNDIMGHTLFLLMSAVKTENFTAVLDSCYSGDATRGQAGYRLRSREAQAGGRDTQMSLQISPKEKAYQDNLLSKLQLSRSEFVSRYRAGVARGIVLAATQPDELAREAQINGFHAGLFTYYLTQYLWQQDSSAGSAISNVTKKMPVDDEIQTRLQTPRCEFKVKDYQKQPIYFLSNANSLANAVITERKGNTAKLWLGGVNLEKLKPGAYFNVVGGTGKVMYQSREGLVAIAKVQGNVKLGTLLRTSSD
jgi:metacaspase-1